MSDANSGPMATIQSGRMEPTQRTLHAVEVCPDCGPHLAGEWVHRTREVIEIPLVPIEVTEHVFVLTVESQEVV